MRSLKKTIEQNLDCINVFAFFFTAPILHLTKYTSQKMTYLIIALVLAIIIFTPIYSKDLYIEYRDIQSKESKNTPAAILMAFIALVPATTIVSIGFIFLTAPTSVKDLFIPLINLCIATSVISVIAYKVCGHSHNIKIKPQIETFLTYFAEIIVALIIVTMVIDSNSDAYGISEKIISLNGKKDAIEMQKKLLSQKKEELAQQEKQLSIFIESTHENTEHLKKILVSSPERVQLDTAVVTQISRNSELIEDIININNARINLEKEKSNLDSSKEEGGKLANEKAKLLAIILTVLCFWIKCLFTPILSNNKQH